MVSPRKLGPEEFYNLKSKFLSKYFNSLEDLLTKPVNSATALRLIILLTKLEDEVKRMYNPIGKASAPLDVSFITNIIDYHFSQQKFPPLLSESQRKNWKTIYVGLDEAFNNACLEESPDANARAYTLILGLALRRMANFLEMIGGLKFNKNEIDVELDLKAKAMVMDLNTSLEKYFAPLIYENTGDMIIPDALRIDTFQSNVVDLLNQFAVYYPHLEKDFPAIKALQEFQVVTAHNYAQAIRAHDAAQECLSMIENKNQRNSIYSPSGGASNHESLESEMQWLAGYIQKLYAKYNEVGNIQEIGRFFSSMLSEENKSRVKFIETLKSSCENVPNNHEYIKAVFKNIIKTCGDEVIRLSNKYAKKAKLDSSISPNEKMDAYVRYLNSQEKGSHRFARSITFMLSELI